MKGIRVMTDRRTHRGRAMKRIALLLIALTLSGCATRGDRWPITQPLDPVTERPIDAR